MDSHLSTPEEELVSANGLANWSFVGILMPVVGWILGPMSLSKINKLRADTQEERILFDNIRSKAWWGISLSIISLVVSSGILVLMNYNDYTAREKAADNAILQDQSSGQYYCDPEFYEC